MFTTFVLLVVERLYILAMLSDELDVEKTSSSLLCSASRRRHCMALKIKTTLLIISLSWGFGDKKDLNVLTTISKLFKSYFQELICISCKHNYICCGKFQFTVVILQYILPITDLGI